MCARQRAFSAESDGMGGLDYSCMIDLSIDPFNSVLLVFDGIERKERKIFEEYVLHVLGDHSLLFLSWKNSLRTPLDYPNPQRFSATANQLLENLKRRGGTTTTTTSVQY